MFILISFGFIAIRIPDILAQEPPPALKQDSSLMAQAQLEFSKRHYVEALELYRTYLRSYPEDQDAWTRFAAAYYYTGQAKQALLYLQKAKPSIKLKGFSLFYQALCLDALGDRLRSKRYLLRVAKLDDPLAEDALFELIAIVYEDADVIATRTLSEEYLRRFREGRFRTQIEWLNSRLALAGKLNVEGTQRSRYRSSFFEQHPLSILTVPHIWHYQLGYYFERGTRSNPGYGRSKPVVTSGVAYEEFNLNANAGIGLGPFKGKGTESFAGYIYEQEWLSNADRLKVWTDDTSDLQYFPFRPDLMERHHRFYVETLGHSGNFLFGAYAHWQILRAGSESFPAPERPEIRKAFDVGTENLFVPWVEWNYHSQNSVRAYLLFQKFINREQNDFSNKTYSLFDNADVPFLSATLEHNTNLPRFWGLKLSFEAFRHEYQYNDFWESYTSLGGGALVRLNPWPFLALSARVASETNSYTFDLIRSQGCNDAGDKAKPAACPRVDKITNAGFSASYITSRQQAFSFLAHYFSRKNDTLNVYDETELDFLIQFTQAFPTLNQSERYIEPFRGISRSKGVY